MALLRVLVALALGTAVYLRFLRRPTLTWGATGQEADARLPGDELLEGRVPEIPRARLRRWIVAGECAR